MRCLIPDRHDRSRRRRSVNLDYFTWGHTKGAGRKRIPIHWTNEGSPAKYCGLEDLLIECNTPATTATGLALTYAQEFICRNVQIADFVTGVAMVNSPNTIFENVECSYSAAGNGIGWAVDGSTPLGNVSSIWRDCSFAGNSSSQTTKGWDFYSTVPNGEMGDMQFFNCSTAAAGFGFDFNFANSNSSTSTDCSSDIILRDCVNDEFYQYGVRILGANSTSLVKIEGGYFNVNNNNGNPNSNGVGVYSTGTVLIEGCEFIAVETPFSVGPNDYIAIAIQLAAGADDSHVADCSINGWTRGVYVNGANRPGITGNRFFSTPVAASLPPPNNGFGIAMIATTIYYCASPTIVGNSYGASASGGMMIGVNLDSSVSGTAAVVGNTFNPITSIGTLISNAMSSPNTAIIVANPGYNPTGGNSG